MFESLVQVATTPIPLPTTGVAAWLTPATLLGIGGLLVTIIGALTKAVIAVLQEVKSTKRLVTSNAEVGAQIGEQRDRKLDRIEILVNGRYGEVLQELATLRQEVATHSGKAGDQALANAAQVRATDQIKRVVQLVTTPEGAKS
jgi:hypothetical protein